jgi:hypothetical protein
VQEIEIACRIKHTHTHLRTQSKKRKRKKTEDGRKEETKLRLSDDTFDPKKSEGATFDEPQTGGSH